ncbi:MAG: 4Fe-4S dicluster domain-containing protein [Alphaproteobacteria bacterium]|nr:4Fe-4S dicluster domain-containing protein [Alphaproteobacteria bacterium]
MTEKTQSKIGRRDVLKGAGAVAAGTAAAAMPVQTAEAAKKVPRWGMVMDLRRCIGCSACTVACKAENNVSLGRFRTVQQRKVIGTFPNVTKVNLPIICNHCEGNEKDKVPPCVTPCPEYPGERLTYVTPDGKKIRYRGGATYKRPDGLILIDAELCIGCGKCIDACPYGVRSFDPFVQAGKKPEEQAADKCDFCKHRIDNGVEPACVNTCQGRARIFGDLNDPDSEVSRLIKEHNLDDKNNVLLPEEGTRPSVYYIDPDNLLKTVYTKREKGKLDHYVDTLDG